VSQFLPDTPKQATTVEFTSLPPNQSSDITRDSIFSWKKQPHSVYAVELRPYQPFNLVPAISLFTSKTSFRWSDLGAYGIGFPISARYTAMVTSIPVASVDQIASLDWWYGRAQRDARPESKLSGVNLTDPNAPIPDPDAPSNVMSLSNFPAGLPLCAPGLKGQTLDARSMGHKVTMAGRLGRGYGTCLLGSGTHCSFDWALTDVPGSSLPIALGRPVPGNVGPSLSVIATGLLQAGPVLTQANLCRSGDKP
jgi:hypothetical protein